jgi:hypothetical protein
VETGVLPEARNEFQKTSDGCMALTSNLIGVATPPRLSKAAAARRWPKPKRYWPERSRFLIRIVWPNTHFAVPKTKLRTWLGNLLHAAIIDATSMPLTTSHAIVEPQNMRLDLITHRYLGRCAIFIICRMLPGFPSLHSTSECKARCRFEAQSPCVLGFSFGKFESDGSD